MCCCAVWGKEVRLRQRKGSSKEKRVCQWRTTTVQKSEKEVRKAKRQNVFYDYKEWTNEDNNNEDKKRNAKRDKQETKEGKVQKGGYEKAKKKRR
jgi:hypothetical protein